MFEPQFCVVELFGHSKIAGKVSEQAIGGQSFVRVDVPATEGQPSFTKLYGQGAIYSITPVDEATCLIAVKSYQVAPIEVYHLIAEPRLIPPQPVLQDRYDTSQMDLPDPKTFYLPKNYGDRYGEEDDEETGDTDF